MTIKARFLTRTDVPPLPQDAPIDAIAQWLARQIELRRHIRHFSAALVVSRKFGRRFTYKETVKDRPTATHTFRVRNRYRLTIHSASYSTPRFCAHSSS
jgi:hypothetical protein